MQIVWALFVGAMLAFAPSSAQAHAGHSHSHPGATAHHEPAPKVASAAKVSAVSKPLFSTQSVSVASQPAAPADHPDCDGQGCCTSGPCTGYHGFVLTSTTLATPSLFSTMIVAPDALPSGGAYSARLRRPPKFFA
jgi:hypothetical protein